MLSRGGWALTLLAGSSVSLLTPGAPGAVGDLHGQSFSAALLGLGTLVQLALAAWVLLAVGLSLAHAPAALIRVVSPRLLRRALFAGAVGALTVAPAQADRVSTPSQSAQHDVAGLRLPDRPVAAPAGVTADPAVVVVRPGDTLWAIAARSLPPGATDADIARACAQWHAANRDVIGADPDLIFPTQRLAPPLGKEPI